MTRLSRVLMKCPECGAIIMTKVVMSTNVQGYGLNMQPLHGGYDPKPWCVLTCPKCKYTACHSGFSEIEWKEGIRFLEDTIPPDEKYALLAEKALKESKYSEAAWNFLTASWYSKGAELMKMHKGFLKCMIHCFETLTAREKAMCLELGLNICLQDDDKNNYQLLKKLGKKYRLIKKENGLLFRQKKLSFKKYKQKSDSYYKKSERVYNKYSELIDEYSEEQKISDEKKLNEVLWQLLDHGEYSEEVIRLIKDFDYVLPKKFQIKFAKSAKCELLSEEYATALFVYFRFGNLCNIKKELEKLARYYVRIGHPSAADILMFICTEKQLVSLGNKLKEAGRLSMAAQILSLARMTQKQKEDHYYHYILFI